MKRFDKTTQNREVIYGRRQTQGRAFGVLEKARRILKAIARFAGDTGFEANAAAVSESTGAAVVFLMKRKRGSGRKEKMCVVKFYVNIADNDGWDNFERSLLLRRIRGTKRRLPEKGSPLLCSNLIA